jgi:hypothetical protein
MALTFSLWSIEDSVYAHTFGVSVLFLSHPYVIVCQQ